MDTTTARGLIALNNRFYAEHAASFSATRRAPWAGWERLAEMLRDSGWTREEAGGGGHPRVLDVACGNLRFERFLSNAFPKAAFEFHAWDSCSKLAEAEPISPPGASEVHFSQVDVLKALPGSASAGTGEPSSLPPTPSADLVVCFGFMHHVPGAELRQKLMETLVRQTAREGFIAISFWQFMDDPRLAAKARTADDLAAGDSPPHPGFAPAELDADDHFLGWKDDPGPLRYCHHFPEREIDELSALAKTRGACEITRYSSDGATGHANRYLVLQRFF